MERYLSTCSKTASAAATATKTVASDLVTDSRQCGHGADKTHFPGIGAAQLLDLPFGVKLPRIPGSDSLYRTTKLSEKLFQPSYGFNLTDPYCRILENQYNSLHDPHLRAYHRRKDILGRLKKGGYITSNNEVVCSLKEFNKYREYLRSLKLDFEKNCVKEQLFQPSYGFNLTDPYCRILENQYNSLHDPHLRAYHRRKDILGRLKKGGYITSNNEVVCSLKEFNKYREYLRSLKLDFEKNCVKEQKQALPEKEMASHLPKIQENIFKRKEIKKNTFDYRGQDGTHSSRKKKKTFDDVKVASAIGDQRANKGVNEMFSSDITSHYVLSQVIISQGEKRPTGNDIHPSLRSSKNVVRKSKDGVITNNPSTFDNRGCQQKFISEYKKAGYHQGGASKKCSEQK
ncbi:Fibrous sheath-interacting protein 2 [Manis javanica]|nr:Fibrous sheath-interacting protein 2 [Manis javanica]